MLIVHEDVEVIDVDLTVGTEGDDDVDLAGFERLIFEADIEELHVGKIEAAVRFL